MPVQINEVIVKAVVEPSSSIGSKQPECPPPGNSGTEAEMIHQVLEIIKEKKKR